MTDRANERDSFESYIRLISHLIKCYRLMLRKQQYRINRSTDKVKKKKITQFYIGNNEALVSHR